MTMKTAMRKAKKELGSEAVTVICRYAQSKKEELTTYDISLAHRIAELVDGDCKEVIQGRKVKYVVTK